jgi:2,5-diketo-D-gluconate reductase A
MKLSSAVTTLTALTRNKIGMPLVGFGTYQMTPDVAESSVAEALKVGFRHIDSAEGYNNEEGTGRALKACGIPREELYVVSKLMPGYKAWGMPEKNYNQTIESCKKSLKDLQLEYLDLYMIHFPASSTRVDQYRALVDLQKQGLVKHIGVSNWDERHLKELEDAGLPTPECNQVEFHPLCAQAKLNPIMEAKGIVPVAYSSLATLSSWRTKEGQGGEHKADTKTEAQAVQKEISQRLGVPEGKILLRWGLQRGYVVLTKSSTPSRIASNLDVFGFELSDDDMAKIDALDKDEHIAWAQQGINAQALGEPLV